MDHWKVVWHHDFDEEPVTFWSEIGADGYEVRKVQEFRGGRIVKADAGTETREIGLSEAPVGELPDVTAQSEFSACRISPEDFHAVWDRAAWSGRRHEHPGPGHSPE
ncbi:hypothetical protein [Streptomyces sp. HNM0574]|uniref:DUF6881 domain-containing protein n=1 Tax=Streptomyces sp. HNM0574 TaxID=2714954 RepID=UPI0019CFAD21|nr:hypothetical protein [Streptomyces sp. HNM0574]